MGPEEVGRPRVWKDWFKISWIYLVLSVCIGIRLFCIWRWWTGARPKTLTTCSFLSFIYRWVISKFSAHWFPSAK